MNHDSGDHGPQASSNGTGVLVTDRHRALAIKAKLFRGLSDPSRLSILEALRGGACSVTEVVEITGLSQPNASNHLACLLDCNLVAREARGRYAYYRLAEDRVGALLALADEILLDVAHGVYVCPRYETGDG